jgi:hypothetical protein
MLRLRPHQLHRRQKLHLLPRPRQLRRHQLQVFLVQEITHSHLRRAWAFLVRFLDRATILSLHHKEWVALVLLVRVVLVARVVLLVQVAQVVRVVLVARVVLPVPVLVVRLVSLAQLVPVLVAVLLVELRVPEASVVRAVAQVAAVVVELAAVPPVRLVRAVLAVRARLASQSVQSAKSLNSVQMRHHLVVRLFHAVTAQPFYVCAVAHQFKISQTRLTQLQAN